MSAITKAYPTKGSEAVLSVLNGIDLHICPGDYAALTGPSGSGKSTLMHIIGCLDSPTSGEYLLDGIDVSTMTPEQLCSVRRDKIGFVFQGFQLFPKLTAFENVEYPLMLRGISASKRHCMVMNALERVNMAERAQHYPGRLSGGQQQRVAMARALCYEPRLLLCDEPTGALDPSTRDDMLTLFDTLHHGGHTLLLITHDMAVAARAKRRFCVKGGQVFPSE